MSAVRWGDATDLPLPDNSVHCIVTSPPYNVGIEYDGYDDSIPWPEYIEMAHDAAREMRRVLVMGGRTWVNVMPSVPIKDQDARFALSAAWHIALNSAGLSFRDTVVWQQDSHDGGCAWGSYKMPSAPNLRGGYEVIHCFFKGDSYKRSAPDEHKAYRDPGDDWPELCRNVWKMKPERRRDGAPAPFPLELPSRCIRLSTWPGETVLDPFAGSGNTLNAAEALGRRGIGFDIGAPKPTTTEENHDT